MSVDRPGHFGHMILDNLRKAGVQNTAQGRTAEVRRARPVRRRVDSRRREPTPRRTARQKRGGHLHRPGARHRRRQLVKEAAKEAVKGVGFDILIVCGFAFDPTVSEKPNATASSPCCRRR